MTTDAITLLRIGVPGAPGAGVTAAEKASYVTVGGANTYTNTNAFRKTSTNAVVVENDAFDSILRVNTSVKSLQLAGGTDLQGYSDTYSTETWSIDGATGNMQTDGVLTVDGGAIKGEQLWLPFEFDGGGSALTTGIKRRIKLPYNFDIVSDGIAAWEIDFGGTSGSIGFDLWMDTYANLPPTNADRISGTIGSQNPRVSAATKGQSATLTGWTTSLVKGRYLYISIDSITTVTWATLSIHIKKT